jgi:hypothetical protein
MDCLHRGGLAARRGAAVVVFAALVIGCGSTGLVDIWRDPTFNGPPLSKVLVISVRKDAAKRRLMEDTFTKVLSKHDVAAIPSYRIWEDALPDTQTVADEVRAAGYDGVIVVSKLDTREDVTYVPGYTRTEPETRYNPWLRGYYTYYKQVTVEGYEETERVVRHRIDVWLVRGQGVQAGQLVWTAEGEVIDPTSLQEVSKEISKKIVPELAKAKLLPK